VANNLDLRKITIIDHTLVQHEIDAWVVGDSGFAYHLALLDDGTQSEDYYTVTHLATGTQTIPALLETSDQAIQFIEAIVPLGDWKRPMKVLQNDKGLGKKVSQAFRDTLRAESEARNA